MRPRNWIVVLSTLFATTLCSCQSDRACTIQEYRQEVAARASAREESQKLCQQAAEQHRLFNSSSAGIYAEEAVRVDESNANAWMVLGVLKNDSGAVFAAMKAFDEAAKLAPMRYEPRFNLGSVLESIGCYDKAIREYEAALRLQPNSLEVTENLVRCYIRSGKKGAMTRTFIDYALKRETRQEWRDWLQLQSNLYNGNSNLTNNNDISRLSECIPLDSLSERDINSSNIKKAQSCERNNRSKDND